MSPDSSLEGSCRLLPAPTGSLSEAVTEEYAELATEYGPRNVLVLKRHPAGLERVRELLAAVDVADGSPRSPRVESLPEHASKVIEEYDPTLDRLEYEERIELISLVIDGASRDVPAYLERASDHESFARDVGQLLLEATRQRTRLADLEAGGRDPHECLAFLYAMNDRFHEELERRGYVERADVVPRATALLETDSDGLQGRITSSIDAVLAIEFEEYRRLDRQYLGFLSEDAALVCLGERHASVERTRVEPGRIESVVGDGLEVDVLAGRDSARPPGEHAPSASDERPPHAAITRFLATGEPPPVTRESLPSETGSQDRGRAKRIRSRTAREQVRAVATEIKSLLDRHGWTGDDVAVAVPRIERVPETRRRLREAGIPTATIGTPSLAEDPAVNELYAVVTLLCARDRGDDGEQRPRGRDRNRDVARDRLRARVDDFSPSLLGDCERASIVRSLERWIVRTDLKGRIASDESWVDAREQFEGIRRVLEIARFVERTDLIGPDWRGLRRMLRRTIQYDAPYVHAVETRPPTGGVTVCSVDALKYDSREAVFVLDLIDENYPGEQFLTGLFPTAWLRTMATYPAVTDPSRGTIRDTFATAADPDAIGDPFETYHAQRSRRRLALGSRAARSVLYVCSYERGSGGLRRSYDESRYLKLIDSTPGLVLEDVETSTEATIHGESNAIEALLDQPRGELERVLCEASTGGQADLTETEALFEEIAVVLEGDVDEELAAAVRSQFAFAVGDVIPGSDRTGSGGSR
ncbi:hypothetical protein EA462_10425 [Natrarchaeobius halalkaliphilus]|uniref:Uncharacterized protein n=1 Tax=Natrarchaeobius halalkaliphilus TaxID=1679091 RepID=A0A3N6M164_9EURY|nr:hypothetical protein [Natrarchaeobius halalkaliphilus]RQG88811.1 hypothetical protein EA462_10425 [Natrarchaeobius halalkaliphilus]